MGSDGVLPPITPQTITPAPLATDAFDRANENPIAGNWTSGPGVAADLQLLNNAVKAINDVDPNAVAFWNAITWPADQWSEVTIQTRGTSGDLGPAVRIAPTVATYYLAPVFADGRLEIYRAINHSFTRLSAVGGAGTVVPGDRVRLEAEGTVLRVFKNGVLMGEVTDGAITSGAAGIFQDHTSGALDDWAGGAVGSSPPPPSPPAAPTNLAAAAASASQIDLSWTDNATNEDGFRIERCAGPGCSGFVEIATVGANVVSYQNTGLTASTSYSYRVRAHNTAGTSVYSNTATATTPAAPPAAPAAPTSLGATATSPSQINLSWTDNATNEDGFRIERCAGPGCSGFVEIATVGANVVSYQNTGLTASTSYSYRVRAHNSGGASAYSNTATTATPAAPPAAPAAPTSLGATAASPSQINLGWTDNATNEDGFRIERCAGTGCSGFVEIATVGANVVSYQNTGLTASTTYRYRVRAYNGGGTSSYSNTATATTQAPPAADRLPDLGMARLSDLRLGQSGGRRLLRYSMTIVNVGSGKFELRGRRASTSEPQMSVVQRIFNDAGGSRDVSTAAVMEFGGDGHSHWHVHELALSELFRLDDGVYLARSDKLGFCFWDNVRYRLSLPGAPQSAVYGESGCGGSGSLTTAMGLSIGWGDIYPYTLPDQNVDITGLADGRYRLVVTADASGWFAETNDNNNVTWVDLELLGGGSQIRVLGYGPSATIAISQPDQ